MSESFSGRLRHLREKKNLTQNELAKATGIPRSTIASWEAGKRTPELGSAQLLADFFGVSLDYLLGRVSNPGKDLMPTTLEDFLEQQEVKFDGVPLTKDEKEGLLAALKILWRRHHDD